VNVALSVTVKTRISAVAAGPAIRKSVQNRTAFAQLAGVARARMRIVTGATGRLKVVEIAGVEQGEMVRRMGG